jgi:hypothetical protein
VTRQDTGYALVTLPDGRQVGAAVTLEVVDDEVHLSLSTKPADTAVWNHVYARKMTTTPLRADGCG